MKYVIIVLIFLSCGQSKEQQQYEKGKAYTDSISTSLNRRIDSLLQTFKLNGTVDEYGVYYNPSTGGFTYRSDTLIIGDPGQPAKQHFDSVGTVIIGN